MSTAALKHLLTATQACLDFIRLDPDLRRVVREHASEYEKCLDASLSQQLELVSGLMDAYARLSGKQSEYFGLGEEPQCYADAMRGLDGFVAAARDAVSRALNDSTFACPAEWISVRAQTFALVLRSAEAKELKPS